MIVLGHRKARWLQRAISGSVAEELSDDGRFLVVVVS
ncbi:hypothetical protein FAZ78_05065 [Cereibacter changlensis]|uniref:Universal stress protein n=1 Tax=Cereibacter changlensis TaxID=402884 RepID=A0A4U0Z0B9_9RHOB|nr:hypothetical protein FAZ78_05065 [Cereibacter changlensis]